MGGALVILACPGCGAEFESYACDRRKFCSRTCSNRSTARYRDATIRVPESPTDRAYLAAIIDGEGFISRYMQRATSILPSYYVGVTNTDWGLMEWLAEIGGTITDKGRFEAEMAYKRQCWQWNVRAAADVVLLLSGVVPYMRIKKSKALDVLEEMLRSTGKSIDGFDLAALQKEIQEG